MGSRSGRIVGADRSNRRPDPTNTAEPVTRSARILTAADVRNATFREPLNRPAYNPEQADALLERIAARLCRQGDLTPQDIRIAAFSRPRAFVRGHDPNQVDQFLEDAVASVSRLGWA